MTPDAKSYRLWQWCCSRGFVFIGYIMIAIAAISLYQDSPAPPYGLDYGFSTIAVIVATTLILAGLASMHAVVYGLRACSVAMIKLEIPSLRILAIIIGLHGLIDFVGGEVATGALQVGLASILIHEMRALSVLRKGTHGGHI